MLASDPRDLDPQVPLSARQLAPLDWARLLAPISGAHPSGPNLEYRAEFAELELLARGTPDRQMGSSLVTGQAPDYGAALQRGAALLERTKDVRVLAQLLWAAVPALGIPAFVTGLGALRELLERYWDSVHPELDPEDEAQATARANATMACASPELVQALRRAPLLGGAGSAPVTLEQAVLALREASSEGGASASAVPLPSVLRNPPPAELAALLSSLQAGLAHTTAITALFAQRSGAVPNLQALQGFFRDALAVLRQQRAPEPAVEPSPAAQAQQAHEVCAALAAAPSPAPSDAGAARPRNPITGRDDVLATLEGLCAYYRAHEPASPVPLLLRRCQRLVGLDFLATLRELAPEAVDKVALLGGVSSETARTG